MWLLLFSLAWFHLGISPVSPVGVRWACAKWENHRLCFHLLIKRREETRGHAVAAMAASIYPSGGAIGAKMSGLTCTFNEVPSRPSSEGPNLSGVTSAWAGCWNFVTSAKVPRGFYLCTFACSHTSTPTFVLPWVKVVPSLSAGDIPQSVLSETASGLSASVFLCCYSHNHGVQKGDGSRVRLSVNTHGTC